MCSLNLNRRKGRPSSSSESLFEQTQSESSALNQRMRRREKLAVEKVNTFLFSSMGRTLHEGGPISYGPSTIF